MAQAQLDLILNAQKYQRDLVQALGITEKQAAAQAIKMAREQQKAAEKVTKAHVESASKIAGAYEGALAKMSAGDALAASKKQIEILDETTKDLAKTQEDAAGSSSQMGRAFSALATQAPDLWTQIASGGDPLVALQQQGLQVVQQMGDVGGQLKSVAGFMTGPWGVAAAGAATAAAVLANQWHAATDESRNLAESIRRSQEAIDPSMIKRGTDAWREFTSAVNDAHLAALIDIKEISQAQLDTASTVEELRAAGTEALRPLVKEYANLASEQQLLNKQVDSGTLNFEEQSKALARLAELRESVPDAMERLKAKKEEIAAGIEEVNLLANEAIAREAIVETEKDLIKKKKEYGALIEEEKNALATARSIGVQSASDLFSEESKLTLALEEQVAALEELQSQYKEGSEVFAAAEAAKQLAAARTERERKRLADQRADDEAKAAALAEAELAKQSAEAQRAAERQMRLDRQVYSSKVSLAASSASAVGSIAQSLAGDNETAQRRAWAVDKASAIAAAGLNTALAVSNAFADVPYPANIFAAIEAGVQGAAHFASVAASPAPQFYAGGTISAPYADPRGTPLSMMVDPRERIKIEPQGNDRQDNGVFAIENYWDGKQVDTQIARRISRGGPTAAVIRRRSGKLGHSSQFRSG